MKKLIGIALLGWILSPCVSQVQGTEYFVDGNVVASGTGSSWEQAFKTIAEANTALSDGEHTVKVRGDYVYREKVDVDNSSGLSDSQRITFEGVAGTNPCVMPIISGATNLTDSGFVGTNGYTNVYWITEDTSIKAVWEADPGEDTWTKYTTQTNIVNVNTNPASYFYDTNSSNLYIHTSDSSEPTNFQIEGGMIDYPFYSYMENYISIQGFRIRHSYTYGSRLRDCESWNVYSNTFYSNRGSGMHLYLGCKNGIVSNNTFYSNGGSGIFLQGNGANSCNNNTFYNNTIYSNSDKGIYAINFCSGNTFYNNTVYSHPSDGIYLTTTNDNCTLYNNTCYSNSSGLKVRESTNATLYNNNCYANSSDGMYFYKGIGHTIYNNTIYDNADKGIYINSFCTNVTFFNNNIWSKDDAARYCIYLKSDSQTGFQSDYNNFYVSGGAKVGYLGVAQDTLTDWKTASGQDTNSISQDPCFVDVGSYNLHLLSPPPSPCVNRGTASFQGTDAPDTDIYGDARPNGSGYDIGSDEFLHFNCTIIRIR